MLKLFQPHHPLSQQEIHNLEDHLLFLVRFYFPNHSKDIQRLEQFISRFAEHNEDNLKILLQILIGKHKHGLEAFFKLLDFLEERSLLDHFYKIHFQYALSISAVEKLFKVPIYSSFLQLALRTPIGKSSKDWSAFETFGHYLLIYAAQNNLKLDGYDLRKYESFWKRLYTKFLAYSGYQDAEAQKLLNNLVQRFTDSVLQ